jgi:hypothetical protein
MFGKILSQENTIKYQAQRLEHLLHQKIIRWVQSLSKARENHQNSNHVDILIPWKFNKKDKKV